MARGGAEMAQGIAVPDRGVLAGWRRLPAVRSPLWGQAFFRTYIRESYTVKAKYLRGSGIHPPCVVTSVPVAYYVGCAAPWDGGSMCATS